MKTQNDIHAMRHSAEHVLTMAMLKLYGKEHIVMAMGPATDDGFYFDFDPSANSGQSSSSADGSSPKEFRVSQEQFPEIEKEMQNIIKEDIPFVRKEISPEEAKKLFKENPYKMEWIMEIEKRGEPVSIYQTGDFVDLCSGPHVASTGKIGAVKLLSVAGAYWHGDEKNKMLTRIYGTAYPSQSELDTYMALQEEAKKRDHRVIGKELDLFVFSELVGKGLPLLTPKGTTIRRELERFTVDEELKRGYQHVITPPLAKTDLYKTSGHYPYYKNTMYPAMKVDEEELILRPMTCPHHFMLYKSKPRSYKELPIRFAEISPQFRYEKSGELTGLMRVRMFCLADAHIMCKKEDAKNEIEKVLDLIDYINETLGMKKGEDYRYRLSLGNRTDTKKYYKDDRAWDEAEQVLRDVLEKTNKKFYFEAENEAAFYGPKIDIQVKNVAGKEETAFTVQYDFVMPKRFEMRFINEKGLEEEPIVIHRSSIGAFERTMAFLIEKYGGAFPTWLSPVQAKVLPIADRHAEYAKTIVEKLKNAHIRVELDDRKETLQSKIRDAQMEKASYMLILGDKEQEVGTVAVRGRNNKNYGQVSVDQFIEQIRKEIDERMITPIEA